MQDAITKPLDLDTVAFIKVRAMSLAFQMCKRPWCADTCFKWIYLASKILQNQGFTEEASSIDEILLNATKNVGAVA